MTGHLKLKIKSFVAQIEHTVIVTKDGPMLTTKLIKKNEVEKKSF